MKDQTSQSRQAPFGKRKVSGKEQKEPDVTQSSLFSFWIQAASLILKQGPAQCNFQIYFSDNSPIENVLITRSGKQEIQKLNWSCVYTAAKLVLRPRTMHHISILSPSLIFIVPNGCLHNPKFLVDPSDSPSVFRQTECWGLWNMCLVNTPACIYKFTACTTENFNPGVTSVHLNWA